MSTAHEQRNFVFEIRAESDEKTGNFLSGKPIVYESKTNIGMFDEIIRAGALKECDLSDIRFLINHDTNMIPLARYCKDSSDNTMTMSVDDGGMNIRVQLDTENNADARKLYSAVQRGDISGMSFMFTVDDEEWLDMETEHPTRIITKIGKVFEVSAVTFPAYGDTTISARSKQTLDAARSTQDKADGVELEKLKAKYLYNI